MTATPAGPDGRTQLEILDRCAATVARLRFGPVGAAELDAAIADLHLLPDDLPARGPLAANLVAALLQSGFERGAPRLRPLDALLEIAERNPPTGPEWAKVRAAARVASIMRAGVQQEAADPRAALTEMTAFFDLVGDDPRLGGMRELLETGLTFMQATEDGDEATLRRVARDAGRLRELGDDTPQGQMAGVFSRLLELWQSSQRGDLPGALRQFDQLRESTDALGPDHYLNSVLEETHTMMAAMRVFQNGDDGSDEPGPMPSEAEISALQTLTERPDATDGERAFYHTALGAASLGGGQETDLGRIDEAIESFRRALASARSDDPQRVFHLQSLSMGLLRRAEVTGSVATLEEAARVLTEARDLAGGPQHQLWALLGDGLALVRRRLGEPSDSRQAALEGLRRYNWHVLLQSDTAAVAAAARDAAERATDIACSCLADNEPLDAIRALDAGRGLILFAATEFRDVTTRLEDADQWELADRWREATAVAGPDGVPTELRREVLEALSGSGGLVGLLDPPSLPEIRKALRTLDADALVYLVPGTSPNPGWAVIAPAQGRPSFMALTNLVLTEEVDVERYLTALAGRDAVLAGDVGRSAAADDGQSADDVDRDILLQNAESRFLGSLDALCDWAWRAAIGPLLERYLASRPAPNGRLPRVVLVPVGGLARIPWQAARRGDGRYALEFAAFSQAASARMLCESAASAPIPLTPVGLMVGDPDTAGRGTDLVAARIEAYAIHQAFYRGARYVGRRPDGSPGRSGTGTGKEVRDWLTSARPGAGAMLHLACHGVIETDPEGGTSYLLLADGDRLTADELVNLLAGTPERDIGLVVLAACRTGVSVRGYDEAYSLGTAFLASGVRSVLSTQWSIPDRATSALMFMFHHFLMVEGRPTWDALHRAQLWMLDPERQVPDQMPRQLRRQLRETDPTRVVAWAGFVHWGR